MAVQNYFCTPCIAIIATSMKKIGLLSEGVTPPGVKCYKAPYPKLSNLKCNYSMLVCYSGLAQRAHLLKARGMS
jgi:hypothetical protein